MRPTWCQMLLVAAVTGCLAGQQPKSQPQLSTTAGGMFLGKSGKPVVGARLILCEAIEDRGVIKLLPNVPTATVDKTGRFEFKGFAPGRWTIIYLQPGMDVPVPNQIDVSPLEAVEKSILPLMVRVELGTTKPYEARPWGPQFTLLKGHTFWSTGPQMRLWNATVRRGQRGPFLEMRRGAVWLDNFADKREIKFDAWSF